MRYALLLLLVSCTTAKPPSSLERVRSMADASPDDGGPRYVLARSAANKGQRDEAIGHLEALVANGRWDYRLYGKDFAPLAEDPDYIRIERALNARAPKVRTGTVAFEPD